MKYLAIVALVLFTSCTHNIDVSHLDEYSLQQFKQTQALKITDDVTTAVMAAYKNDNLPKDLTIRILTINKQARDVIKGWPADWPSKVQSIIANARQALTTDEHIKLDRWLNQLSAGLAGVQ